ncbi:hypothetical protein SETIT_5G005500v2 [Setaria italica]|uniref:Uncharacterized protein n=1 Tax=Setaria italica TaxID=4555 RepID=A0A368R045_SETIT|nr:hypothetical protein SETIT_5G005500v2 [Setaria italica]
MRATMRCLNVSTNMSLDGVDTFEHLRLILEMNNVRSSVVSGMDVAIPFVWGAMVKETNAAADEHKPLVPPAQSELLV